jgi:hypothetical protein
MNPDDQGGPAEAERTVKAERSAGAEHIAKATASPTA